MHGFGKLEVDGSHKTVTVTVDGVVSKMSVVEHDGALHLFSSVRMKFSGAWGILIDFAISALACILLVNFI